MVSPPPPSRITYSCDNMGMCCPSCLHQVRGAEAQRAVAEEAAREAEAKAYSLSATVEVRRGNSSHSSATAGLLDNNNNTKKQEKTIWEITLYIVTYHKYCAVNVLGISKYCLWLRTMLFIEFCWLIFVLSEDKLAQGTTTR